MRSWAAVALVAVLALASAQDSCGVWPPYAYCQLQQSETFFDNTTTVLHVSAGHYAYFLFQAPTTSVPFIRISLSALNGDPDLYICNNAATQPSFFTYDYSSRSAGLEDSITIQASSFTPGNTFSLAVHGFTDSLYRLTYIVGDDVTTISNGQTVTDSVNIRNYQYYLYVFDGTDPATIVLTRLTGDPDLYIGYNPSTVSTWKPTASLNNGSELAFGDDVMEVAVLPGYASVTIGVYGSVTSQYTLVVSQNDSITLIDGVPQAAYISYGNAATFQFLSSGSVNGNLTLLFSVSSGSLEFFMSSAEGPNPATPSRQHSDWNGHASYNSPYQLTILQSDPFYLNVPGGYYILVHATSQDDTAFTVTMKSQLAVSPLQSGQPAFDTVNQGQYRYYSFSVTNSSLNVMLDLTPINGDADMYVSCTKSITGTDAGIPSRLNSTWASFMWGEDTIYIQSSDPNSCALNNNGAGGTFYIAVYGFVTTTYSITANLDDGTPIRLTVGQPQSGRVFRNYPSMFVVQKPSDADTLTVTVTPLSGDPDLYVLVNGSNPSSSNYAYKSNLASGNDVVTITPQLTACRFPAIPSQCYCTSCDIQIAVVSFSSVASYTITISTDTSMTTLQDGVPFGGQVPQFTYNYFRFMCNQANAVVQVTLTALAGDPDLTVALTPSPTLSNGTWRSLLNGSDTVIASPIPVGYVYIGVFGFTNASYSILAHVASANTTVQLSPGHPVFGYAPQGNYLYYSYSSEFAAEVTFTVTPLMGQVGMYVNSCVNSSLSACSLNRPTATSNTWNAGSSASQATVTVPTSQACKHCYYIIGVLGITNANFTILGSTNTTSVAIALQESIPYSDSVAQWDYEYFVFRFFDTGSDLLISVTPYTGDPDLYVSACSGVNDTCNDLPSNVSYTWKHNAVGADTILIPAGSPGACVPQPSYACSYYIAVHGYTASSFSVMASLHSDSPVMLLDGNPQNGMVVEGGVDQYFMNIPPASNSIDITLIPRTGDSDLFVRLDGQKPRQDFWQYRAISAYGNDNIEISGNDTAFIANDCIHGCTLTIAVYGFRASEYSIIATSSGYASTLLPGVPMRDAVVQGTYDYYYFTVDQVAPVAFVLTPLSGDPDLFITWGPNNTRPTTQSYTWASQRVGVDAVTIQPTDSAACNPTLNACRYNIGVYGYSSNTAFILTAYLLSSSPVELVDGQPQNGQVPQSLSQQYVYYVSRGFGQFQITLSPSFGDPDLYVSVNTTNPPGPGSSDYSSLGTSGPEVITIFESDPLLASRCGSSSDLCPIFIAVNGFTNSTYSIIVTSADVSTDLSNGVPLYDTVSHGVYKYYVFRNDMPGVKLTFAVTPYSGDPDLYVSTQTNPQPTLNNYTWASMGIGRDVVEVSPNDPNACGVPCSYYIGVTAFSMNASYSVVAIQTNYTVIQLTDGQPQVSSVTQGSTDQYFLYAAVGTPTITITLSQLYGDSDLYVNLNGEEPSFGNAQYYSMNANGDDLITISSSDSAYQQSPCNPANANASFCVVYIGVGGYSALATYAVLASSTNAILLLEGMSQSASVNASQFMQFIFEVHSSGLEVDLVLTPMSGDPDMYVSTTENANFTNNHWRANSMGMDVVQIFPDDPNACTPPCRYYIGVTGFGGPASFTLSGSTGFNLPSLLTNGRPQSAFVNTSVTKLYYFDVPSSAPSFQIRVSAVYGDPDIYVNLGPTPPGPGGAQYRALSSAADDSLTISTSDPTGYFQQCLNTTGTPGTTCRAYIGVFGFSASQYSITATLSDGIQQLQEGVPASGNVNNSQYIYYKFIATALKPYTFTLTPVSGDPDMYMSVTTTKPTLSNYTWFSNGLSTEVIRIDPTQPNSPNCPLPCSYYIGVTGFLRPAAYQLIVTSNYTFLLDGSPQQGHVGPLQYAVYVYRASANVGDLSFLITQLQGVVQVFVTNAGLNAALNAPSVDCSGPASSPCSVSNYFWTSLAAFDRSSISIPSSDPNACTNCYYLLLVLSNSQTASADYSVVAASSEAIVSLTDGVPHTDVVSRGAYEYYRIVLTQPSVDVQVIVTPYYGDPDLYLSWHADISRPNMTNNDARSTSQYNDSIYVQAANLGDCFAAGGGTCQIYVSVYGYSNSSYSIVSYLNSGYLSPVLLVNGVPQSMSVATGAWVYFAAIVNVAPNVAYSFTLAPSFGDADMFVTTNESEPTRNNYNYTSSSIGFDAVTIAPGSAGYCTQCTILVGVYGYTSSQFTILFTTNTSASVVPLRDGVPEFGQIAASTFRYYKVYVGAGTASFSISVSSLSGNPQSYTIVESSNSGQYVLPNAGNAQWSSVSQGSLVTIIRNSDSAFRAPAAYVIGVTSPSASSFFITSHLSSITSLANGQPQVAYATAGTSTYFVLYTASSPPSDLTVRVSNPGLTLFAVNDYDSNNPASLPSPSHSTWSSLNDTTSQNILVIPSATSNTYYTIAVYSTASLSFTITASSKETVVTLVPGAPSARFNVSQNVTQHFVVDVSDISQDLIVSVSPLTGDPDVYIARRYNNPGCEFPAGVVPSPYYQNDYCFNYTWASSADTGNLEVLQIRAADPCNPSFAKGECDRDIDWQPGQFFIGVFGYSNTVFDITVLAGGVTSLVEGQTTNGITSNYQKPVFLLTVPATNDPTLTPPSISFQVTAFQTVQPDGSPAPMGVQLYVLACQVNQCGPWSSQPSPNNVTWFAYIAVNDTQTLFIADGDSHYCDPTTTACNYYVSLYPDARCHSTVCDVNFQIAASILNGKGLKTIRYADIDGVLDTVSQAVDVNSDPARFELWLAPGASSALYFELDACTGPNNSYPILYLCDQSCNLPPQPTDPSNTANVKQMNTQGGAVSTSFTPSSSSAVVYAAVTAPTVSRSVRRAAVSYPRPGGRALNVENPVPWRRSVAFSEFLSLPVGDPLQATFMLKVASSPSIYHLSTENSNLVLSAAPPASDGHAIIGFELSWGAAMAFSSTNVPTPLAGVKYTIYYSSGGFPSNIAKTTPCGLQQSGSDSQVLYSGTHWISDNLLPSTKYEVNVVAYCSETCWAASGLQGVLVDTYAYTVGTFTTPEAPPAPTSNSVGITVLIVFLVVIGVGVGIGVFIYCKRKRAARLYQYEMFEMNEGGTYSTPGDAYSAMD